MELPLLRKELIEKAERPATYVRRVAFAAVLYGGFIFRVMMVSESGELMGAGQEMLKFVSFFLCLAICLIQPAYAASTVTSEKERESLVLLDLSPLSNMDILFEKFLGAVLPVVSYLFLVLPLFVVVYQFGGVSVTEILLSALFALTVCLYVAAVGLWCSVRYASSDLSLRQTYQYVLISAVAAFVFMGMSGLRQNGYGQLNLTIFSAIGAVVLLGFSHTYFTRYAYPPPGLDRVDDKEGVVRAPMRKVYYRRKPPVNNPVAWRELNHTRKYHTSISATVHLAAVALMFFIWPTILMALHVAESGALASGHRFFMYIVWPFSAAWIANYGVTCFAREREGQTLEALLSTPMSSAEVLQEKVAAGVVLCRLYLRPLYCLYVVTLASQLIACVVFVDRRFLMLELVCNILVGGLAVWLMPRIILWASVVCGLLIRPRLRALLVVFFCLGLLQLQPVVYFQPMTYLHAGYPRLQWSVNPWSWVFILLGWGLLYVIYRWGRRVCIARADAWLRDRA